MPKSDVNSLLDTLTRESYNPVNQRLDRFDSKRELVTSKVPTILAILSPIRGAPGSINTLVPKNVTHSISQSP